MFREWIVTKRSTIFNNWREERKAMGELTEERKFGVLRECAKYTKRTGRALHSTRPWFDFKKGFLGALCVSAVKRFYSPSQSA